MIGIKNKATIWVAAIGLASLLAIAACGGSSNNDSSNGQQSQPQDNGSSATTTQPSQSGGGSGESSSAPPIFAANPCDAFSMVGGGGGLGGFISQATGGANFDTSDSPQSGFAKDVAEFAEKALEQVFDGNVSADCFLEATMDDEGGIWISFTLPSSPPAGAGNAVGDAMKEMGATVGGVISTGTQAGGFELIALESLPIEAPNGGTSTGGLYFVTSEEGASQAVLLVGYEQGSSQDSGGGSVPPAAGSGSQGAATTAPQDSTSPITAMVPTGIAKTINDGLQPALEEAFGVSLVVETFFQTTSGENSSVTLGYGSEEELPTGSEAAGNLTQVVEALGGTVATSMNSEDLASVTFEGLQIGDFTSSGFLTFNEGKLSALFTSVSSP